MPNILPFLLYIIELLTWFPTRHPRFYNKDSRLSAVKAWRLQQYTSSLNYSYSIRSCNYRWPNLRW